MSVWKSDEKLLISASLISPSKIVLSEKQYQAFDTVFHHQMKHLEVRQKYSAACRIFNSFLSVSSGDETLRLMLDIRQNVSFMKSTSLIWFPEKCVFHKIREKKNNNKETKILRYPYAGLF